MILTGLDVE